MNMNNKHILKPIFIFALLFMAWSNLFVSQTLEARQPTPLELKAVQTETLNVFKEFLQLWQEERYFEMYKFGKKHSKKQISLEEFATRMVELDWVPVGLMPKKTPEILYRYRTLLYVDANIVFRHKSYYDLQFTKQQSFLVIREDGQWRFDLLQMIHSPYYSPPI